MKKQKINLSMLITILFVLVSFGYAQVDSSNKTISVSQPNSDSKLEVEKKLIFLTYRKLEVYNAVAQYREGRKLEDIFKNKGGLAFTLSNFKTGNIEEIQQKLYNEMISEPSGEIIQLTRSSIQNTINGRQKDEQVVYKAEWIPGKYARAFDRNWTIDDVLKMETATYYDVERYTSFDVEVVFEGKNRKYRALVLNHGSSDNPKLEFWDAITGMGGNLTQVWKEQVLPYGISNKSDSQLGTIHSNAKFAAKIHRFLNFRGKNGYADNTSFACPNNSKELRQCCISSTLAEFWEIDACNAWESDANLLISNPSITSNLADIQFYSSDHQYHLGGGSHFGRSRFRPQCSYIASNQQRCYVQLRDQGHGDNETDHDDNYYHVGKRAEQERGNTGSRNQDVSCDSSVGFGFNRCIFSNCNVGVNLSVSGSGVGASATITGGELWNTARAEGLMCSAQTTGGGNWECNPACQGNGLASKKDSDGNTSNSLDECCILTPIIVDIDGDGFDLTNPANGVMLRF